MEIENYLNQIKRRDMLDGKCTVHLELTPIPKHLKLPKFFLSGDIFNNRRNEDHTPILWHF